MANGIVLNIDTTKSEFQNPMIELRQGDGNYQSLDVTVTSNGSPFNLTGWTITFMGTTAGGLKIVDTAVSNVDTANGKFTYTPTKAWGQDEGMFKEAYFKFTSGVNGNSVASGASIRVNVLTAVDLTAEEAGDYISIVDQTIATLNEDLTTLQSSVDQLKAQNNAIKTTDNTWTGTNTFNKQITGSLKTRPATFTDFATVASNMVQYAGLWVVNAKTILNSPISGVLYGIIEVIPAYGSITGIIRYSNVPNWASGNYVTTVDNGAINGWQKTPDNSTVVHTTGTETIAGNKTFTSPISGRFVSKDADVTDFNDVAKSMYSHAGIMNVRGTALANGPVTGMTWYTVVVNPSIANDAGNMVAYANDKMFYTGVGSGVVQGWVKVANDSNVVHVSGTETINGDKTFLSGNYGLRVTSTGIQKTSDNGVTWTNI